MAEEDLTAHDCDRGSVCECCQVSVNNLVQVFVCGNTHELFEGRDEIGSWGDVLRLVVDVDFNLLFFGAVVCLHVLVCHISGPRDAVMLLGTGRARWSLSLSALDI